MPDATDDAGYASNWHGKLFAAFRRSVDPAQPEADPEADPEATTADTPTTIESAREALAAALLRAIQSVSNAHDRDDITRWLAKAAETLSAETPITARATELYKSIDSRRVAGIVMGTARTSLNNYKGANLPLAIKVALPVTLAGLPFLGLQGAGLVAFGGGVGLPVVLLLFLGSAGIASVVEALVKDSSVRDPLTRLLMAMIAAESARRVDKELLKAMRADATVPERAEVPAEHTAILSHLVGMDPFAFERHVMTFFEDMGHPVGVTAKTNDGGFDGYVIHPDGLIVVQCKRYATENLVGGPEVQQLMGVVMQKRARRGYVVTTSGFTRAAKQAADSCDRLFLVDGSELVQWHIDERRSR